MICIDSRGQGSGSQPAVEMAHVDAAASESYLLVCDKLLWNFRVNEAHRENLTPLFVQSWNILLVQVEAFLATGPFSKMKNGADVNVSQ